MIIVKFYSGIGNQLFQYGLLLNLKKIYPNSIIKVDLTTFSNDKVLNNGNGFSYGFAINSIFNNIDLISCSSKEIQNFNFKSYLPNHFIKLFPKLSSKLIHINFIPNLRALIFPKYKKMKSNYHTNSPFNSYNGNYLTLNPNSNYYFDGLWQNFAYISNILNIMKSNLIENYNLPNEYKSYLDMILNSNSVLLHLRRGNFVSSKNDYSHNLCNLNYYKKAFSKIENNTISPKYFVFSDDISFAKEFFSFKDNLTYIDIPKPKVNSIFEFYLMRKCKHSIIPNSTFSWWASMFINNSKSVVILPKYFVRTTNSWHEINSPQDWVKIDNLGSLYE